MEFVKFMRGSVDYAQALCDQIEPQNPLMKEHNSCAEDSSKSQVQEKERNALKSFIVDEVQEG
jgi:hypothetical protein